MRALIAGATGFVGRRLAPALIADGLEVRCLARDPAADVARDLERAGCEVLAADLDLDHGLAQAMEGVDVAYFLVHMIGRDPGYPQRERDAASRFARAAKQAGVAQVVYLGGLGDPASPHLISRHETAEALRREGPPLTYFRAAMVVGAGSESYVLVRDIARRLPALPNAEWLGTRTQPIGIRDVIAYLRQAPFVPGARDREVQIGGPDVLAPGEVVDRMARALGRRPPRRLPMPGATPAVVSAAADAVTSGDGAIAAELALGLSGDTAVTDRSGAELFEIRPESLDVALQRALEADERSSSNGTGS